MKLTINSSNSETNGLGQEGFKSRTVGEELVQILTDAGVQAAFGISGGAVAGFWDALARSPIRLLHYRHEAGAAFAALECYFASGRPAVVVTTTGPGITNSLTGLYAARWEGAKLIFVSAATPVSQWGRGAFQETNASTMGSIFFSPGALFHYAVRLESADQLSELAIQLYQGLARPGGFVAHISVPTTLQTSPVKTRMPMVYSLPAPLTPSRETIIRCSELLNEDSFAIWLGFGARAAVPEIRQLAERTGAAVLCSPRAKGIFPENHAQFVGVTGFGGHDSVLNYMREQRPARLLVLGSRLGEFTSFWRQELVPARGFIHVDIDPRVPGAAYPAAPTLSIQSDVGAFVTGLLASLPERSVVNQSLSRPPQQKIVIRSEGPVRPEVLMEAIQRIIVDGSDAIVMTEAGNAFAWGTHSLRFSQPGRYRVSTGFGSMGHAATGVLGAALARAGKAVAIVGDGAMLMNNEVNTAVHYRVPAAWIVLNDSGYGMIEHGMRRQGYDSIDVRIPSVDFVQIARAMGADGIRVEHETGLEMALTTAMSASAPFVVDVLIDASYPPPFGGRVDSLIAQGLKNS